MLRARLLQFSLDWSGYFLFWIFDLLPLIFLTEMLHQLVSLGALGLISINNLTCHCIVCQFILVLCSSLYRLSAPSFCFAILVLFMDLYCYWAISASTSNEKSYINWHMLWGWLFYFAGFTSEQQLMSAEVIRKAFQATEEGFLSVVTKQWPEKPQIAAVGSILFFLMDMRRLVIGPCKAFYT